MGMVQGYVNIVINDISNTGKARGSRQLEAIQLGNCIGGVNSVAVGGVRVGIPGRSP